MTDTEKFCPRCKQAKPVEESNWKVKAEIAKCEVVCRNCRIRHTAKRGDWTVLRWLEENTWACDVMVA